MGEGGGYISSINGISNGPAGWPKILTFFFCRSCLRVRLILAVVLEVAITVVVCQLAAVGVKPALTVFSVILRVWVCVSVCVCVEENHYLMLWTLCSQNNTIADICHHRRWCFFQVGVLFSIGIPKCWPLLAHFGFFVANLRSLWRTFYRLIYCSAAQK